MVKIEQASLRALKSCIVLAVFFVLLATGARAAGDGASDDARRYDALIARFAEEHEVDPALVKAVIGAESAFDRKAVSRAGARGLMQLMPATARHHGVKDPSDPRQNIRAGVRLLRDLLDQFDDDARLALAAYNAGGVAVARFRGLPPYRETRRFVRTVMKLRARYAHQAWDDESDEPIEEDEDDSQGRLPVVVEARVGWPRRAETIWFGAGRDADGGALRAALHSPEDHLGAEPSSPSEMP